MVKHPFVPSVFKHLNIVLVAALVAASVFSAFSYTTGKASTVIKVTTTIDNNSNDGLCSLREAIISANKDQSANKGNGECPPGSGADTIILPAGTYTLTKTDSGSEDASASGDLDITSDLTILGAGADKTFIDGSQDGNNRVFQIFSANVTMINLTIRNGNDKRDGGNINNAGKLTLDNVVVTGGTSAMRGGGIYNASTGTTTVPGSGTVTVNGTSYPIFGSTISANNAAGNGGAIMNDGGTLALTNTTISGNGSKLSGGGIYNSGTTTLKFTTIANNIADSDANGTGDGGGGFSGTGSITAKFTIIGANQDNSSGPKAPDCFGTLNSQGYNLIQNTTLCTITGVTATNKTGVAPKLSSLAVNAGPNPTPTLALSPASPAVETGPVGTTCEIPTDQRGIVRPQGYACDIGAFELEDQGNTSWPRAISVGPTVSGAFTSSQNSSLTLKGQSRWYRFLVQPNSKVVVTLTNLQANYDLTLYKDIGASFKTLASPQDLNRLGAEFAPDAFSPDAFSPDAFSPDQFSPDAFSPDAFSPDAFSPDAFSPDAFSPDAFSPDAFSPDAFSPDAFSPDQFSPDAFSPDAFSPDAFSPDQFSPDAFSGAQTRSLLAVSAFDGTASEGIAVNTWDSTGYFYVRVRGRNGNFNPANIFKLTMSLFTGQCTTVQPITTASNLPVDSNGYKTVILTDLGRMPGTDAEKATLWSQLQALAGRPEVQGALVNVGDDARVAAAFAQADLSANSACPFAQELAAEAIKNIVTRYRQAGNPLEYVVIIGSDNVIPFFRHPDQAMLGNEKNFVPPVLDNTPSQASLKLGYVLSQEDYGASISLSIKDDTLPVPDLAVGRLVETPTEVGVMLNAYLGTSNGVLPAPASSLVTGYDFLADGAQAVSTEIQNDFNIVPQTLIQPGNKPPTDSTAWTADQLRAALLGSRHDLVYLAGHFSASSTLAADYTTRMLSTDLVSSSVDLTNAIIFSAGCHAGYNIVDAHAVPNVTPNPDWSVAFAQKGATLIAGTGYQYGDTDFVEYSERLYLEFTRQLGRGGSPVSVGKALVQAKQAYLSGTAELRPIHEKVLLESTLFGLPMLSVTNAGNNPPAANNSIVDPTQVQLAATNPGNTLGLNTTDVSIQPTLTQHTTVLSSVSSTATENAIYYSAKDGVTANPAEPVLPLDSRNVTLPGNILRGVGFRGGTYQDQTAVLPLTGAAVTELRGIHPPFITSVFFPVQNWFVNYFDALSSNNGQTILNTLPAQYLSSDPLSTTGTLRKYGQMSFRLFFNNNIQTYAGGSTPALAAAPSIIKVSAVPINNQVTFTITAIANPSAGVQNVWITYTGASSASTFYGKWQSLDLQQNPLDSTQWIGLLNMSASQAQNLRFMVQAANGVGLVSLSNNMGRYWTPGPDTNPTTPTTLTLNPPTGGPYGNLGTFSAVLTSNGSPLANQVVSFGLGSQFRLAVTDGSGTATASIPFLGVPGDNELDVAYAGNATYIPSSASGTLTITRQVTRLILDPLAVTAKPNSTSLNIKATLSAPSQPNPSKPVQYRPLLEKTVFFVVTGPNGSFAAPVITNYLGQAVLNYVNLPGGIYTVNVYFDGSIPLPGTTITVDDERYLPSTASGSLTLDTPPVAVDDTYATPQNTQLNVPAPGVLWNDTDADNNGLSAVLVTPPGHGTLTLNPDGSFTYKPASTFSGTDSFTYKASDGIFSSNTATVTLVVTNVNQPPVCTNARPNPTFLWPPSGTFAPVKIFGVEDPEMGPVTIRIDRIFQDEPVDHNPDGAGIGTDTAQVDVERNGNGDGRVYHIFFTATDQGGATCSGEVKEPIVDHDMGSGVGAIDGGALYDSTIPGK